MAFSDFITFPNSQKIVLFEIDTSESPTFWFCKEAGIWGYKITNGKNTTTTFENGSFCYGAFQGTTTGNVGTNFVVKQISSFTVVTEAYTEVASWATLRSTNKSYYLENEAIYVHFDGFATPSSFGYTNIELGVTIGFANKDIYLNDNFYQGKILSVPSVGISVDNWYFGIRKYSSGSVQLINNDGYFDQFIDQTLYGQACRILLGGNSLTYAQYEQMHEGYIKSFKTTTRQFSIIVGDKRDKIGRTLPVNYYDSTTYTDIKAENDGKPIPMAWGNIRNAPVICLNEDEAGPPANYEFLLVDCTEHSVVDSAPTVYVNGSSVAIGNWDASDSTFTISNANYTAGDTVTADFQGYDDSAGKDGSGSLISHGLDILKDIFETLLDITYNATNFDIDQWDSEDNSDYAQSIFINEKTTVSEIYEKIAVGHLGVLYPKRDGTWTFKTINDEYQIQHTITEDEILADPERDDNGDIYLSSATIKYYKDWADDKYTEYTDNTDEATIFAEYGVYKNKDFETYLYLTADATTIAGEIMDEYGTIKPEMKVVTTIAAAEIELFDNISIYFNRKNSDWMGLIKCRVTAITYNLNSPMNITLGLKYIEDWTHLNKWLKNHWTNDTETFPASLGGATVSAWDDTWTTEQKRYARENWGFWATENDLISDTDPDSDPMRWATG